MKRGISLLEVLFSMLLVTVGLFGILALLPVAAHQAKAGRNADTRAVTGEMAVSEFLVRDMDRTANWYSPVADFFSSTYVDSSGNPVLDSSMNPIKARFIPYAGYCIDPIFVASQGNTVATAANNGSGRFFPFYSLADPTSTNSDYAARMERISLENGMNGAPMTLAQAVSTFASADDLFLDRVADSTIPASQIYARAANMSGVVTNRQRLSENQSSWFATLSPEYSADASAPVNWMLHVVILNNRSLTSLAVDTADTSIVADERLVDVTQFPGQGLMGGEVLISPRGGRGETDIDVKPGDWVMLSGCYQFNPGAAPNFFTTIAKESATPPKGANHSLINTAAYVRWDKYADAANTRSTLPNKRGVFAWYRVADVDPDIINGNQRAVTLEGGHWPLAHTSGTGVTQMTIVTGAVSVYMRSLGAEFR